MTDGSDPYTVIRQFGLRPGGIPRAEARTKEDCRDLVYAIDRVAREAAVIDMSSVMS
jgi:hypothetical protein